MPRKNTDFGVRAGVLASFFVGVVMAMAAVPALALNPERHYEMVTPLYKGGYGVASLRAAAPDGESMVFKSLGAFAGSPSSHAINEYVARRGSSGWSTASLMPAASVLPSLVGPVAWDFSPNLEVSLTEGIRGTSLGNASTHEREDVFVLHQTDAADVPSSYSIAGMALKALKDVPLKVNYLGSSPDFSHILFQATPTEPLLPLATAEHTRVGQTYDLAVSGEGAPGLRLVDLNDKGELIDPNCGAALGTEIGATSRFNAIAADGSEIFFTTDANRAGGACDGSVGTVNPANPAIVFARVDGERTLEVSVPLASDCAVGAPCASATQMRAQFNGANEAGTCVFFMTAQPLVTGDTDTGNDLYVARIGHPGESGNICDPSAGRPAGAEVTSLTQLSHDPHGGEAAEVQGVVSMSSDGSRVYFVAHGLLSEGPNAEGRVPVKGADNLYFDETGSGKAPTFIADLCSGPEESGEVSDGACPSSIPREEGNGADTKLWLGSEGERETADDGRYLLFPSYGQLLSSDVDRAEDLYRYDALTGTLDRVSAGENGDDADGNNSAFGVLLRGTSVGEEDGVAHPSAKALLGSRSISEDGSRIVFISSEPLSPDATIGLENAYEWHLQPGETEGRVSLISTGHSTEPVNEVLMSASGRDVFFITSEGLVSGDTDGLPDVYDARLGEGFPEPAAEPEPCSGDACQGPLTNPAPLLVPGSVSQAPGENVPAPPASMPAKKSKPKPKAAKCRRPRTSKKLARTCKPKAKAKRSSTREARR